MRIAATPAAPVPSANSTRKLCGGRAGTSSRRTTSTTVVSPVLNRRRARIAITLRRGTRSSRCPRRPGARKLEQAIRDGGALIRVHAQQALVIGGVLLQARHEPVHEPDVRVLRGAPQLVEVHGARPVRV